MRNITLGMALYHINKEAKKALEEWGDRERSSFLYSIKNAVINKLNKKPIDAHTFPMGVMYLYEIDGFTFHHRYSNGHNIEPTKSLSSISSEDKLCLSTEEVKEAYKVINDFIGFTVIEY
ncbi:MAG: hypothetical protein IE916_00080 [Epsilonproteobacteria bacterium]|nr:hypothetical protein [Campylobacterota bacterium]